MMQTLAIDSVKSGIGVNCLAPTAATRMTEGLMRLAVLDALVPEAVVPAMLVLPSHDAPCGPSGAPVLVLSRPPMSP